jgi:hypothetical protein
MFELRDARLLEDRFLLRLVEHCRDRLDLAWDDFGARRDLPFADFLDVDVFCLRGDY